MFKKENEINDFDQMIKSILDEGQEEVPARVWEAVSEGLDKAEQRKTVVIWFRRAAVSVAAAAAVTAGVIFNIKPETGLVQNAGESGLIAVVEPQQEVIETPSDSGDTAIKALTAIAEAESAAPKARHTENRSAIPAAEAIIPQTASDAMEVSDIAPSLTEEDNAPAGQTAGNKVEKTADPQTQKEYFPENWEEEKEDKRNVSLMLSGLASTNSTQSQNRMGLMKAPTISSAPSQTGITETSTNSTYGLPVSFGAGVKIGLSPRWSLGVGANYSILTRQFYGKYTKVDASGNIVKSSSSDIRNTQHYIGIPVNAYYDIVNKDRVNLYAYAGGTVEKCVADNYSVLSTSIQHREKVKGLQLSANFGVGVEFMLGQHLGLYLDPSVRYYFDCNQPKNIRTVQPFMLGFELGLRARL